jgi:hypothetical protein
MFSRFENRTTRPESGGGIRKKAVVYTSYLRGGCPATSPSGDSSVSDVRAVSTTPWVGMKGFVLCPRCGGRTRLEVKRSAILTAP